MIQMPLATKDQFLTEAAASPSCEAVVTPPLVDQPKTSASASCIARVSKKMPKPQKANLTSLGCWDSRSPSSVPASRKRNVLLSYKSISVMAPTFPAGC